MADLNSFIDNLHHSSRIVSRGHALVMDQSVDAVELKNLYGQIVVWGFFSIDGRKGKFVGKLANNASTEGVEYFPL